MLWTAIERCDALWHAVSGAFDPTILDALEALGYDRSFESIDRADGPPPIVPQAAPGWSRVQLDYEEQGVCVPPGVRIDLGGIGKGLAVDLIAQGLVDRGAASACVALGGDVRVAGDPPNAAGWSVPVEDPVSGVPVFQTGITKGALAMSTTLIRRWHRGGREVHHIVDPSDGLPAEGGIVSAVVAAKDAWWAEGLAKAAIVAGRQGGAALLHEHGVAAWFALDDGTTTTVGPWSGTCPAP